MSSQKLQVCVVSYLLGVHIELKKKKRTNPVTPWKSLTHARHWHGGICRRPGPFSGLSTRLFFI